MNNATEELPDDLARAPALLAQERARRVAAEAEAATAKAETASAKALVSHSEELIARQKLEIDKVCRELYGSRSKHKARLLEQMDCSSKNSRQMQVKMNWRRKSRPKLQPSKLST